MYLCLIGLQIILTDNETKTTPLGRNKQRSTEFKCLLQLIHTHSFTDGRVYSVMLNWAKSYLQNIHQWPHSVCERNTLNCNLLPLEWSFVVVSPYDGSSASEATLKGTDKFNTQTNRRWILLPPINTSQDIHVHISWDALHRHWSRDDLVNKHAIL